MQPVTGTTDKRFVIPPCTMNKRWRNLYDTDGLIEKTSYFRWVA